VALSFWGIAEGMTIQTSVVYILTSIGVCKIIYIKYYFKQVGGYSRARSTV